MFSMVLMAAMTTGSDLPDFGRRGRGCHGCGGGCYGGMAWGGCYGGYGMGRGGYGMGYGGGGGWGGGYAMGFSPMIGGYAYSPMISNFGTPIIGGYGTRSLYYSPATANQANEATIIVHMPAGANLTVDGQPTQSRSSTRIFHSPPLEQGKTYTYTLRAETNRDGQPVNVKRDVEVQAGRRSEVTLNFDNAGLSGENSNATPRNNRATVPDDETGEQAAPTRPQRTRPANSTPAPRSFPTPPRDR